MHLKSISIESFRGIEGLDLDNLGHINIFVGKNNSGKTSILEAIFLLIGSSNPQVTNTLNALRKINLTESSQFRFIFNKLNFENDVHIKSVFDEKNQHRSIKITPFYGPYVSSSGGQIQNPGQINGTSTNSTAAFVTGLNFITEINEQHDKVKEYNSRIIFENGIFNFTIDPNYKENALGLYIPSEYNYIDLYTKLDFIIQGKHKNKLIKYLRLIDDSIVDISLGNLNMIYVDIGLPDRLIPLNMLGDGMVKILVIIANIFNLRDCVVLIDEIENGLHFSALSVLWKAVIDGITENNIQLFITTHSYEALKDLSKILKEDKYISIQKKVKSFKVQKLKNGTTKSYPYNFGELEYSLDQEIEIR